MDDSLMIFILILFSMVTTQECNELGRLITHLPHQVESDVFSRTIVEVQNKSIPNVLDFVNSTLTSVNKHQRPAPHSLVYIPIARSTKKKFPWCIWSLRQLISMNILPGKEMRYYA